MKHLRRHQLVNWVLFIVVVLETTTLFYLYFNKNYDNLKYLNFVNKEDSLNLIIKTLEQKQDSLNKSIKCRFDTIIKIKKEYEKDYTKLLNKPIDEQCEFFSEYLLSTSNRFSYCNNSDTVKTN